MEAERIRCHYHEVLPEDPVWGDWTWYGLKDGTQRAGIQICLPRVGVRSIPGMLDTVTPSYKWTITGEGETIHVTPSVDIKCKIGLPDERRWHGFIESGWLREV